MGNPSPDSAPDTPQVPGSPSPAVPAAGSGDQPSSSREFSAADLVRVLSDPTPEVKAAIEALVGPIAQKVKDSDRYVKALNGIDPIAMRRAVEYVNKYGGVEEGLRQMAIDDVIVSPSQPPQRSEVGASGLVARQRGTAAILKAAGVPFADPEYVALVQANAGRTLTDEQWFGLVDNHLDERKAKAQADAAAAAAPPMPEGNVAPPASGSLQAQYDAERDKLAQGDVDGLYNLKAKYRKQGLEIH